MMHFAALVVLAVSASAVPGLAATLLPQSSHLQANPKRDPMWALTIIDYSTPSPVPSVQHVDSKTSPGDAFIAVYPKRDDISVIQNLNPSKRSLGKAADSATTKRDTDDSIQRSPPVRVWPYFDDVSETV